jgi:peptidoglycan/LPS O-acetylase OafA/YrhL
MRKAMQRLLAKEPEAPQPSTSAQKSGRRYHELDWLRALIILALVPAHAVGFYTATTSKYYSTQYSSPIGLSPMMTIGSWGIGLLFLVAGAAATFAIARRSPRQYIVERFVRLLIPFLFASLTLIPLQVYLVVRAFPSVLSQIAPPAGWNPQFIDSPLNFYVWFVGAYFSFLTHYSPQFEFIFWSHLWFIPRLFIIALLTLPLLLHLRTARGERYIAWLADLCERYRGFVFLLAVPLFLVDAILGWQWQGWQVVGAPDSANVLSQFLFFTIVYVYGFVLYSDARLRKAVRRDGRLGVLAVAILAFGATQVFGIGSQALAHDYSAGGILGAALRTAAAWLSIVAAVGLSMRLLDFTSQLGRYLTEASYPFYVLHLAVLYLVGLPLLTTGAPAIITFTIMVIATFAITFAVYELLIRRIYPLRVLFGLSKRGVPAPA